MSISTPFNLYVFLYYYQKTYYITFSFDFSYFYLKIDYLIEISLPSLLLFHETFNFLQFFFGVILRPGKELIKLPEMTNNNSLPLNSGNHFDYFL